jgi:hypothetical protein
VYTIRRLYFYTITEEYYLGNQSFSTKFLSNCWFSLVRYERDYVNHGDYAGWHLVNPPRCSFRQMIGNFVKQLAIVIPNEVIMDPMKTKILI